MRALPLAALFLALALACTDATNGPPTTGSPTTSSTDAPSPSASPAVTLLVTLSTSAGESVNLLVEIANTPEKRARGLMLRETLEEDSGMLFFYPADHQGGFWMKDTLIPLSIAFILQDGTIIDIQDMEPNTTNPHRPAERYRHALEVNKGWFDRNGVAVGDLVELPVGLSP